MTPLPLSDVPLHLALFLCGAIGYMVTRWANKRFFSPRFPPLKAAKLLMEDDPEESQKAEPREPAAEPSPRAVSGAAAPRPRGRAARRRASVRKEEVAEPSAQIAVAEPLVQPAAAAAAAHKDLAAPRERDAAPDDAGHTEGVEEPNARVARLLARKAARKARKAQQLAKPAADACEVVMAEVEPAEAVESPCQEADSRVCEVAGVPAEEVEARSQEVDSLVGEVAKPAEEAPGQEVDSLAGELAEPAEEVEAPGQEVDSLAGEVGGFVAAEVQAEQVEVPSQVLDDKLAAGWAAAGAAPGVHDAVPVGSRRFSPILSHDGQQLYTDGEEVYVMACLESDGGDALRMVHPVTDPTSPWHQMVMDGEAPPALTSWTPISAPLDPQCGPWAPIADEADRPWLEEPVWRAPRPPLSDESDKLWDACWEFVA